MDKPTISVIVIAFLVCVGLAYAVGQERGHLQGTCAMAGFASTMMDRDAPGAEFLHVAYTGPGGLCPSSELQKEEARIDARSKR